MDLDALSESDVLAALTECQKLGKDEFYKIHGKINPNDHFLIYETQHYDVSSIASAAHLHATGHKPSAKALSSTISAIKIQLDQLSIDTISYSASKKDPSKERIFGEIPGIKPGHEFIDREDARLLGVHCSKQAGIVGSGTEGAESIVSSYGYEDDMDLGDRIIYTGHGGQENGKQVSDQNFSTYGNAALLKSELLKQPVRVIRRIRKGEARDKSNRYRYDGLFMVTGSRRVPGKSGLMVCRFTLDQISSNSDAHEFSKTAPLATIPPSGNKKPEWKQSSTNKPVRSRAVSEYVKRKYENKCQVCQRILMIHDMPHSEGAHIRPLGAPDYGPDEHDNILCLCPNCHVQFDNGAIVIDDDLRIFVNGTPAGELTVKPDLPPSRVHLAHRRSIHQ